MEHKYDKKKAFERIKQIAKERDKKHGRLSQKEITNEVMMVRQGRRSKYKSGLDKGLEELRAGKVHKYKTTKAMKKEVWT